MEKYWGIFWGKRKIVQSMFIAVMRNGILIYCGRSVINFSTIGTLESTYFP